MSRSQGGGGWRRAGVAWVAVGAVLVAAPAQIAGQQEEGPADERIEERQRPPEVERAEARRGSHEVRRGDTLWDLAGHYLTDPFEWPRIFRINTGVVEDPHWIYPGEVLALPADGARVSAGPRPVAGDTDGRRADGRQPRQPTAGPEARRRGFSRFGGSSVFDRSPDSGDILGELGIEEFRRSPLVSRSEFYGASFLADPTSLGPTGTTGRKIEENPLGLELPPALLTYDRVVLDLGALEASPGDTLQAFRLGRRLADGRRVVHPNALVRIDEVEGDSARASVVQLFGSYHVGDPVGPTEAFLDAGTRVASVEGGMTARILAFSREQPLLGSDDAVFLDVGASDGVALGDEFAVFSVREGRPAEARLADRLAVVRVVRVGQGSATARVVNLAEAGAMPGSPVRLVARPAPGG